MRFLVVCGLSDTIATFSPTRRFTRVDLPTFGRPTTATSPDRNRVKTRAGPGRRPARCGHGDAAAVRLLDREQELRLAMDLAGTRNVAEPRGEKAAESRELLLLGPAAEKLLHFRDVHFAGDGVGLLPCRRDFFPLVLVLVGDLSDDLLQKVFHRDEPGDSAVLVHHDRHPEVAPLELPQELGDF